MPRWNGKQQQQQQHSPSSCLPRECCPAARASVQTATRTTIADVVSYRAIHRPQSSIGSPARLVPTRSHRARIGRSNLRRLRRLYHRPHRLPRRPRRRHCPTTTQTCGGSLHLVLWRPVFLLAWPSFSFSPRVLYYHFARCEPRGCICFAGCTPLHSRWSSRWKNFWGP